MCSRIIKINKVLFCLSSVGIISGSKSFLIVAMLFIKANCLARWLVITLLALLQGSSYRLHNPNLTTQMFNSSVSFFIPFTICQGYRFSCVSTQLLIYIPLWLEFIFLNKDTTFIALRSSLKIFFSIVSFLSRPYLQAHLYSVILRIWPDMWTVEKNVLFSLQNHMLENLWVTTLHAFGILKFWTLMIIYK